MDDDDDDRLPGEIAADIANDDDIDPQTAIRKLLAMTIANQDFMINVLIAIDDKLDLRTVVKS